MYKSDNGTLEERILGHSHRLALIGKECLEDAQHQLAIGNVVNAKRLYSSALHMCELVRYGIDEFAVSEENPEKGRILQLIDTTSQNARLGLENINTLHLVNRVLNLFVKESYRRAASAQSLQSSSSLGERKKGKKDAIRYYRLTIYFADTAIKALQDAYGSQRSPEKDRLLNWANGYIEPAKNELSALGFKYK